MPDTTTIRRWTRQQKLTIVTLTVINFTNAMCYSVQAPFYPLEAEKKGLKPSQYGLVFGIFQLVVFFVSLIIGTKLNNFGLTATLNCGVATLGFSSILFGFLDKINNGSIFLVLSITLRIIEAIGNACFQTGLFAIIARDFPENIATIFAIIKTFFGVGMILEPTLRGFLYKVGGFTLPFETLGSVLLLSVFCSMTLRNTPQEVSLNSNRLNIWNALKIPSVIISLYSAACAAASIGFIQAMLNHI